jgi:hypothetical protein
MWWNRKENWRQRWRQRRWFVDEDDLPLPDDLKESDEYSSDDKEIKEDKTEGVKIIGKEQENLSQNGNLCLDVLTCWQNYAGCKGAS